MLVQVKKIRDKENTTLFISKQLANSYLIDCQMAYQLNLGLAEKLVKIKISDHLVGNEICCSKDLASFFKIDLVQQIHLVSAPLERRITLGPYVGVFVNPRLVELLKKGEIFNRARLLFNAAREAGGVMFFFTCENIRWLDRKIKGITLDTSGSPKHLWLPFPKVFYDRGVNFRDEEKEYVGFIRRQIRKSSLTSFVNTPDYFDKWSTHKHLAKYPELHPLLPETLLYSSLADINNFLTKYSGVYCKGRFGSKGNNIALILKENARELLVKTPYKKDQTLRATELEQFIANFFAERQFVLQQPIKLFRFQGKKADMRVLLGKNDRGNWQVIYNQVRSIDQSSPVTNACKGGLVEPFSSFFQRALDSSETVKELERKIAAKAIEITLALEKEVGPLGEVGIDMALDENLNIWFIEANTKPDTSPEPFEQSINGVYSQFFYLMEYVKYLDGLGSGEVSGAFSEIVQ